MPSNDQTLDPGDWKAFRALAHEMLDGAIDRLEGARELPAWQEIPRETKARIMDEPLPRDSQGEREVYESFLADIAPYPTGNAHPMFFGWVQGTGIPLANMADFLGSVMNPHMAGFNDAAAPVEEKVIQWMAEVMGFPAGSSGILESGGTMANVLGLAVARQAKAPYTFRSQGLLEGGKTLTVYCSTETHGWIQKGAALLGLGTNALRMIPVDSNFQMSIPALKEAIQKDLAAGNVPVCVIATCGTVNTGAIDDLNAIADICRDNNIWFHIDGAFGALAKLSPATAHLVSGVERADSVVFDLHKWMYLPYEIACLLVRDAEAHTAAFALAPSYIAALDRGVIAGGLNLANRGIDLTRNFKALKAWMCIKAYGITKFGELVEQNVAQTKRLVSLVEKHPNLEMLAPAPLNTSCFRYLAEGLSDDELNELNTELLFRLQERGIAVPSSTVLDGKFALRVCIVNHRTRMSDMDALADAVAMLGNEIAAERTVLA